MIVDTSVIIAILRGESDAKEMAEALDRADVCRMSVINYVEAAVVTDSNKDPVLSRRLDDLIRDARIELEAVNIEQARVAREAYRDFGKGRHRARLNLGDCFAYALARVTGEPLLYKGSDFNHTDIEAAGR
jgi:ribonuclease VapC